MDMAMAMAMVMAMAMGNLNGDQSMKDDVLKWFATSDNQGISSMAMASALVGLEPKNRGFSNHPSDPADFNRCLLLLECVPDGRNNMDKVSSLGGVWPELVSRWSDLEQCFLDEVGLDWSKGRHLKASKTYELMKSLGC